MTTWLLVAAGASLVVMAMATTRAPPVEDGLRRALGVLGVPMGQADRTARLQIDGTWLKLRIRTHHARLVTLIVRVDEVPLATDLRVAPEGVAPVIQLAGWSDLELGEPRFDRHIRLTCHDVAPALAIFDVTTRRTVLRAIQRGAILEDGHWKLEWLIRGRITSERLLRCFEAIAHADAAMRNGLERDLGEALAERSRTDPARRVRHRALSVMIDRQLATHQRLVGALDDVAPEIRLLAATCLGAPGRSTLAALLRDAPRSVRVAAARALVEAGGLTPGESAAVVAGAEDGLRVATTRAEAAAVLAQLGTPAAAQALAAAAGRGNVHARRALGVLRAQAAPEAAGDLAIADDRSGELRLARPDDR